MLAIPRAGSGRPFGGYCPPFHHSRRLISLSVARALLGLTLGSGLALVPDQDAHAQGAGLMKEVTITATRTEQDVHDVANTVTVIPASQVEEEMPTDIKDLLRHETGISVRSQTNRASAAFYSTGRGGNEGINVRGLEGNQVLLQSDGVRLPLGYSSGPYAAGRGDYIDVEAFKRAEILRGPASTQFGSDGLAGAVSFMTKDPADLLTLGKSTQAAIKLGYHSVDESWSLVPSFAARGEMFEGMFLASLRRGHAAQTAGDNAAHDNTRTEANPQDTKSDYMLAKVVLKASPQHRFKLTLEDLDRENDTTLYTLFKDPMYPTTTDVKARDDITRELAKVDYEYTNGDNPWFQRAQASLYRQESKNSQWGYEARSNTSAWNSRERTTWYQEEMLGGNVQFESHLGQDVTHRLVYGVDFSRSEVSSLKEGANYLNGNLVTTGSSAFVTNRSFPNTDYNLFGAFIQDEIGIGRLSLIPGLRYDSFELKPKADRLYSLNNAVAPASLEDQALSPKLGVVWKQDPMWNLFGQYSHGFRAPTPSQVNGGVTNLTASTPYTSVGNPNLKSETSKSLELGVRGRSQTLRYSASVFYSKYKDFIASNVRVGGSGTVADPVVYQSVNLGSVDISGLELSGEWAFAPHWSAMGSFALAKGDQEAEGEKIPLDTIDPAKLVLALRYDLANRYGAQLTGTFVERKHRRPDPSRYSPDGYQTFDLTAWYHFSRNASVNLGIFNLFDRKYYEWADVRDIAASSSVLDAYGQPGRNFSASFKYQF